MLLKAMVKAKVASTAVTQTTGHENALTQRRAKDVAIPAKDGAKRAKPKAVTPMRALTMPAKEAKASTTLRVTHGPLTPLKPPDSSH